jgi:hypothetical protein
MMPTTNVIQLPSFKKLKEVKMANNNKKQEIVKNALIIKIK